MSLRIRKMLLEDAEVINRLSIQLGYPAPVENSLNNIRGVLSSRDHLALIALVDHKPAGWVHAFKCVTIESEPFTEIAGLVVDEQYRNQLIGKTLVDAVTQWSEKKGISIIRVRSNVIRTGAHEFYLAIGFTELKQQKVFSFDLKK